LEILDYIVKLFTEWGYWIVFFGVMLENAGLPVPGETILLAAGFFASRHGFNLGLVMLIATTGAVLGDNAGYWIGRRAGRRLLLRYGKYIFLTEHRFIQMERFFHRHGDKTVLVARFLFGFRVFTALFAGASHMDWSKFLFFNVLGAIAWAVVMALLGYFFGESWHLLEQYVKGAGWVLASAIVVALILRFFWKRRKQAMEAESAEIETKVIEVEVKE
jgi:membrane protein DedA with SNARE-associated domain